VSETRIEESSKRAGDELESDKLKKQKIDEHVEAEKDDDPKEEDMKKHMEIVQDEEEISIDAIPLAIKPPMIVEYKIVKEGQKGFYHLIRLQPESDLLLVEGNMLQSWDHKIVGEKNTYEITVEELNCGLNTVRQLLLLESYTHLVCEYALLMAATYVTESYTLADAEHAPVMSPPVRKIEQNLSTLYDWVPIGKSNCYLNEEKSQPSPIYKIVVDILKQTNFFRAFTASSTIPAIYIQQFWDTICFDSKAGSYKCQLDEQWFDLTKDTLRDALLGLHPV
ncbi:hypothetical protein Tco_0950892, partial [Tanacetum coccineum]